MHVDMPPIIYKYNELLIISHGSAGLVSAWHGPGGNFASRRLIKRNFIESILYSFGNKWKIIVMLAKMFVKGSDLCLNQDYILFNKL